MLSFESARRATNGSWQGDVTPTRPLAGVSTDSRTVGRDELFIALGGARADGHDFVGAAAARGAAGALVERDVTAPAGWPLLRVESTLAGLQDLARLVRQEARCPVVAVTGSVGKTTTKDMAAELLGARGPVLKTEGNLNNHIGLPLSLLRLRRDHAVAVLEMGMSAAGELSRLTRIARPDVAVITNAAPVHLEFFDSLEAIAAAKAEIFEGLTADGLAVLNRDDTQLRAVGQRLEREVLWFGMASEDADVRAERWSDDAQGARFTLRFRGHVVPVTLPLPGAHATANFLAAAAVALHLGLSPEEVARRATRLEASARRGRIIPLRDGVTLIDDCYNANPAAVEAAVHVLAAHQGRRHVAFLGDMLELGERGPELHRQVGAKVESGIDVLVAVGALARGFADGMGRNGGPVPEILSASDAAAAATLAVDVVRPGDVVLVKASRGIGAEAVVEALLARFGKVEA